MMLRTSLRNINPALNMFKFSIRKNIGLILLLSAAMLVLSPGYTIMFIREQIERFSEYELSDMLTAFTGITAAAAAIAVVVFNIINFMFLYSKKSGDVFHSLPLKRQELLLSRAAAGVVSTLIPLTLGYLSLCFMPLIRGVDGNIGHIINGYFYAVMCMLVTSAVSLLFIVCAGTVFDFAVSFIGANGGILLAGFIACEIMQTLLIGYNSSDYVAIMKILSPIFYCFSGIDGLYYSSYSYKQLDAFAFNMADVMWYIRCAVYVAVFYIASVLLYKRRKAEKGGQAYAYSFLYIFCGILAGFCGAYIGGAIFSDGSADMRIGYWIGAIAGALLVAVSYGAISDRGFKKAKRSIAVGGVSIALMAVISVLSIGGMFGFTERIPQKDKIESADISILNEQITLYDTDLAIKLHKEIIKNKDSIIRSNDVYNGTPRMYIYFDYNLKNGNSMHREFKIERKCIEDTVLELYKSKERFNSIRKNAKAIETEFFNIYINTTKYSTLVAETAYTTESTVTVPSEKSEFNYINAVINKGELEALIDIYESELNLVGDVSLLSENETQTRIDLGGSGEGRVYFNCELRCNEKFTETFAYLDSLKLDERMDIDVK